MANNPRGKQLLGQAKGILQASLEILNEISQDPGSQTTTTSSHKLPVNNSNRSISINPSSSSTSGPTPTSIRQTSSFERASDEFRRAFPGMCSRETKTRQPPPKRQKKTGYVPLPYQQRETWTHDFYVLSQCKQVFTPDKEEQYKLFNAGLGKKKLVCPNKNAGHTEFCQFLEEKFPKLKAGGGFEVLRSSGGGGGQRPLIVVPPGPDGYSIPYLKEYFSQAVVYIRPIQIDLDVTEQQAMADSQTSVHQIACLSCGEKFSYFEIVSHKNECSGNGNNRECDGTGPLKSDKSKCQVDFTVKQLEEMFPNVEKDVIVSKLQESGSADETLNWLLGNAEKSSKSEQGPKPSGSAENRSVDDLIEVLSDFEYEFLDDDALKDPFEHYQRTHKKDKIYRIRVSRLQEDFSSDVFAIYKNSSADLCAEPKVVFEDELAVGSGPTREYFSILMSMITGGFNIHGPRRVTQVFEGEMDHKIPIANALLAQAGFYKTVGKMIGHIYLHGGPFLYGLSPAIVHWLSFQSLDSNPPPLVIGDVPDIELRSLLVQLSSWDDEPKSSQDVGVSQEINDALQQYLAEANILEINAVGPNRHVIIQHLLTYNVITKRQKELNELKLGMDQVSLVSFLRANPAVRSKIFPRSSQCSITSTVVKSLLVKETEAKEEEIYWNFLEQYIDELCQRKKGEGDCPDIFNLLQFWTGWEVLPKSNEKLQVTFDASKCQQSLVESKSCFNTMTIPAVHQDYEHFKEMMDRSLLFGARGYSSF